MRNLIATLVLLAVTSTAFAQVDYKYESIRNRAGTVMSNYKFAPYTDTSQAVTTRGWSEVGLVLKVRDSASVTVLYSPSWDGVTFSAVATIDSLSNDTNAGAVKYFPLPQAALGFPDVKFSWIVSAFREGKTNDTLDFKVYKRE